MISQVKAETAKNKFQKDELVEELEYFAQMSWETVNQTDFEQPLNPLEISDREQNSQEEDNRLEMDIAIIKFVMIALGFDVIFVSYIWLFCG